MLHRQLRSALEDIFGPEHVAQALAQPERAQRVLYERPAAFKRTS